MTTRTDNIAYLYGQVARELEKRTTAEWLTAFSQHDIPAMPLLTTADLHEDEHLRAVGFWQRCEFEGTVLKFPGPPVRFSRTPARISGPAPRLGEHTDAMLRELGLEGRVDSCKQSS